MSTGRRPQKKPAPQPLSSDAENTEDLGETYIQSSQNWQGLSAEQAASLNDRFEEFRQAMLAEFQKTTDGLRHLRNLPAPKITPASPILPDVPAPHQNSMATVQPEQAEQIEQNRPAPEIISASSTKPDETVSIPTLNLPDAPAPQPNYMAITQPEQVKRYSLHPPTAAPPAKILHQACLPHSSITPVSAPPLQLTRLGGMEIYQMQKHRISTAFAQSGFRKLSRPPDTRGLIFSTQQQSAIPNQASLHAKTYHDHKDILNRSKSVSSI